jgi:hypothetical protein
MTIVVWTWKQIEQDWLAGGRLAADPSVVVEAFDKVEAVFGREWIEQSESIPSWYRRGRHHRAPWSKAQIRS